MAFAFTNTFTANTTAESAKVNTNFSEAATEFNSFPTDGALATGCVDTAQLAADAVDATKIADNALQGEHYKDGSISTANLANTIVTSAKMNTGGAFSLFGTRTSNDSESNALAKTNVYKAGTDGIVISYTLSSGNHYIYTDSSNPPTTALWFSGYTAFAFVVKDDYWKVTNAGTPTIYWLPIGTGSCVKQ